MFKEVNVNELDNIDKSKFENYFMEDELKHDRLFRLDNYYVGLTEVEGIEPKIITTSAKIFDNSVDYESLSKEIYEDDAPYFLLFGTGWGLIDEVMDTSYKILNPIRGKTEYNHLSVRSAVSIILDRLFGDE